MHKQGRRGKEKEKHRERRETNTTPKGQAQKPPRGPLGTKRTAAAEN